MHHFLSTVLAALPYNITANDIKVPNSTADLGKVLMNVITILMEIVGMVSVIALMVGAIQMSLSGGDSKRVATAKETILYAVVGLVIAIAAIAIVTFVTSHVQ